MTAQQEFSTRLETAQSALEAVVRAAERLAAEEVDDPLNLERVDHLNAVLSMLLVVPLPPLTVRTRSESELRAIAEERNRTRLAADADYFADPMTVSERLIEWGLFGMGYTDHFMRTIERDAELVCRQNQIQTVGELRLAVFEGRFQWLASRDLQRQVNVLCGCGVKKHDVRFPEGTCWPYWG